MLQKRWEDNIKINPKERGELHQYWVQYKAGIQFLKNRHLNNLSVKILHQLGCTVFLSW